MLLIKECEMDFSNLNHYLVKGSKGFLYGYAGVASYFLLVHSEPLVQALVGLAAGITAWNWYKSRQK